MSLPATVSSFYALLAPALPFQLRFPLCRSTLSDDADCLEWDELGRVLVGTNPHWEVEDVDLVDLGQGRYRISAPEPFSSMCLDWGDEFHAEATGEGQLTIRSVVLPRRYRHYRWTASGPMDRNGLLAKLIHRLDGGWATVAGGMCTLTVPESAVDAFVAGLRDIGHVL